MERMPSALCLNSLKAAKWCLNLWLLNWYQGSLSIIMNSCINLVIIFPKGKKIFITNTVTAVQLNSNTLIVQYLQLFLMPSTGMTVLHLAEMRDWVSCLVPHMTAERKTVPSACVTLCSWNKQKHQWQPMLCCKLNTFHLLTHTGLYLFIDLLFWEE